MSAPSFEKKKRVAFTRIDINHECLIDDDPDWFMMKPVRMNQDITASLLVNVMHTLCYLNFFRFP